MRILTCDEFRQLRDGRSWQSADKELRRIIRRAIDADPLCSCRSNLYDATMRFNSGFYVTWFAGWGTDCSVTIRVRTEDVSHDDQEHELFSLAVDVNWSSCHRSVSTAVAAMSIYRRAVEFASVIEAMFAGKFLLAKDET